MERYIREKINKRFEYLDRNLDDDQNPKIYYKTKKAFKKFLKLVNFKYTKNEFIGVDHDGHVCIETDYPNTRHLHIMLIFGCNPFSHYIGICFPYEMRKREDKYENISLSKIAEIYKNEMY